MNEVEKGQWSTVYWNEKFFLLQTNSGYRGGTEVDPKGKRIFLPVDVGNEELGAALADAVVHSRWVLSEPRAGSTYHPDVEFDKDLYDYKKSLQRYDEWVRYLMEEYQYKSKRELFKKMKHVYVENKNGIIKITPTHHEKLEMWTGQGIQESDLVVIPATALPVEVGLALRLAFSHCT